MWNWQLPDWPEFSYDANQLVEAEALFLEHAGVMIGVEKHLDPEDRDHITIEILSDEAIGTSEIEGEILDRNCVQSSIRRQLGLSTPGPSAPPAESGIAQTMVDLFRGIDEPLDHGMMFKWHTMIMSAHPEIVERGQYRTGTRPMQIVSGPIQRPRIHFEAPPSEHVPPEMDRFIDWFNRAGPRGSDPVPAVARSAISHLYFECIHPFEDGNGRIGRAIAEKALAQQTSSPTITVLAAEMLQSRKQYYKELESASRRLEITAWIRWFASIVLGAQQRSIRQIEFAIAKARMMDRLRGKLNDRQEKALLGMLREGPDGFKGGLSSGNYQTITNAPPATATRDLADLVEKGALRKTGDRKYARYFLTALHTTRYSASLLQSR